MSTRITHSTDIQNLRSIAECAALCSKNELAGRGVTHVDISNADIQSKRDRVEVPCGPGGMLHDYVPFFFNPKSPMLYKLCRYPPQNYSGGRQTIIHLVTTAEAVSEFGTPFVFTDGHAIMDYTEWFDDLARIGQVDWNVMEAVYWNETENDLDRPRRRMAEFLVHHELPLDLVEEIAVFGTAIAENVISTLEEHSLNIPVRVRQNWYY